MTRATFKKGAKMERMEKALQNPRVALKQIGALLVADSQKAFKAQQFDGKAWDARAPVNVFGVLSDFAQGKRKPPGRRFEERPALRDTGRLASSIAFQVSGLTVEVGTSLDYAAVHQRGGETESVPITGKVRRALWKWLKKQPLELKRRLGWVLNKKFRDEKLKQNVPARPFLGISDRSRKGIKKVIGVEIVEAK